MKNLLPPLFFSVRLPTLLAIFWRVHIRRENFVLARNEAPRFLIFRLDSLGDLVMTTPLFRALKQPHRGSRCTVVVQEYYKPLLVTNPHVDEILTLPQVRPAWLPLCIRRLLAATIFYWTRLRRRRFDYAISPRWDVDEHLATLLCSLTHTACRVGYSESTSAAKQRINRGFDRAFDVCLPPGPLRHEIQRNLAVAEALGAMASNTTLEIRLTNQDRDRAARLLAKVEPSARLVAVGIGAASPSRQWPLERYAEALRKLAMDRHVLPVILCSAAELELARTLDSLLQRRSILLCGAPLREVCAVLKRCELFIGNDSGCAHLAAAMGCGVIVISRHPRDGDPNHFNSPVRFAPHGSHVRVLQPSTGLDDCREGCQSRQPHCITKVSVDEVVSAARVMLPEQPPAASQPPSRQWPEQRTDSLLPLSAEAADRALTTPRSRGRQPSPY